MEKKKSRISSGKKFLARKMQLSNLLQELSANIGLKRESKYRLTSLTKIVAKFSLVSRERFESCIVLQLKSHCGPELHIINSEER